MGVGERVVAKVPTVKAWLRGLLFCALFISLVSYAQRPSDVKPQISVRISTERGTFRPGEDVRVHVEIWNEGDQDLFISKDIDNPCNTFGIISLNVSGGKRAAGPATITACDLFSAERAIYPPLASELPRYWIALPPKHFYGAEVIMSPFSFDKLKVPGKYKIQGKYSSRGFLAEDINNPLIHYSRELSQLPFKAWIGEVETNSVWIEISDKP
jgi:hypothetical protein